jgi:hypothetical protein
MTSAPPLVVHPARRSRRWVHWVPAVVGLAVVAIPAIAGSLAFAEANRDSGTRPAAPIAGVMVWMLWMFLLGAVGAFVTLLAYTLVLPARSTGLRVTQIVFTSLAGVVALFEVPIAIYLMLSL